jgi:hypothetical protein
MKNNFFESRSHKGAQTIPVYRRVIVPLWYSARACESEESSNS